MSYTIVTQYVRICDAPECEARSKPTSLASYPKGWQHVRYLPAGDGSGVCHVQYRDYCPQHTALAIIPEGAEAT